MYTFKLCESKEESWNIEASNWEGNSRQRERNSIASRLEGSSPCSLIIALGIPFYFSAAIDLSVWKKNFSIPFQKRENRNRRRPEGNKLILYHFIRYPLLVIPFHHLILSSSFPHSFILFESFAEFHSLAAVLEIPSLSQESERPFFSSSRERESCSFISVDFKTRIQKDEEKRRKQEGKEGVEYSNDEGKRADRCS